MVGRAAKVSSSSKRFASIDLRYIVSLSIIEKATFEQSRNGVASCGEVFTSASLSNIGYNKNYYKFVTFRKLLYLCTPKKNKLANTFRNTALQIGIN